jgi:serine/threonine protein kinase
LESKLIQYIFSPYFVLTPLLFIFQRGAFSVVYKGMSVYHVGEKVAIKEVNITKLASTQLEDLRHEVNILSQLKHPSIVQLYAVYSVTDKIFLVCNISLSIGLIFIEITFYLYKITEYLNGGELLKAICKRKYYSERDARRVMIQITSAVEYLHQRQVVHGDLKTRNLILENKSFESNIKLVDFGFAMVLQEQSLVSSSWITRCMHIKNKVDMTI